MFQDLRHAARMLLKSKGWTIVIVLSVAFGIGVNTALFSAVNGYLLRSIPVKAAGSLVRLKYAGKNDMGTDFDDYGYNAETPEGQAVVATFPYAIYLEFIKHNQTMTDLIASAPKGQLIVVVDGQAELAKGFVVSGNFYQVLGVSTIAGRPIVPDDDKPSANGVAVISEGYWKRRFGGNPRAIGKVVQVNNTPVTIIGVTSSQFTGNQQTVDTPPDITLPLAIDPRLDNSYGRSIFTGGGKSELNTPTWWWLQIMGRLKPGATIAQVQANLDGVLQQAAHAGWDNYVSNLSEQARSNPRNRNRTEIPHLIVESGRRGIYDVDGAALRSLTIVSVVAAAVLLIVCANVANLLLSRGTSRRKEISIRLSLGATRFRLIRQMLTESILLALLGGVAGLLLGNWGRQLLPGIPGGVPFDWRLYTFVFGLSLLIGIAFGMAPALRFTGMNVSDSLKETSRSLAGSRMMLSKVLLVSQVALSLVLLIGAGLFLATLRNLRNVDVGFNTGNLLLFRVNPQLNRYDQTRVASLYAQILQDLQSVPGVEGVSLVQPALLSGNVGSTSFFFENRNYSSSAGDRSDQIQVSPGFFQTLQVPFLAGRMFDDHDDAASQRVAVINEAAARQFFAGQNPLGGHFGKDSQNRRQIEIVGVVRDTKYNRLREAARPAVYFPYAQQCCSAAEFEIRTASVPAALSGAVREAVHRVDPNLPLVSMTTQAQQADTRLTQERLFAQTYTLFGGLAMVLASIGLFGLMSYNVARRTNEIGIRIALGAQRSDVLRLVMKESMGLVFIGVLIGWGVARAAGRLVTSLLYGVGPSDPWTMLSAAAVLLTVSAFASYLPARKASRVDAIVAFQNE